MNRSSSIFYSIRCVTLVAAIALFIPVSGRAEPEPRIQSAPYADILTSNMKKPAEERSASEAELIEMQRIQRASDHIQTRVRNIINAFCLMFLFGAFSAIWAQNTARNPLLWFVFGAIFTFVTVFVILRKNAKNQRRRRYRRKGSSYFDFAQFY